GHRHAELELRAATAPAAFTTLLSIPGALEPFKLSVSMGGYEWEFRTVLTVEPAALERFAPELRGLVRYA
ncbi:MAG: hypothetical protein AAFV77_03335, partial [Planctomycetota bacterium]